MKFMNYFPYIALALIAVLGYWYINNLTNSLRELESRNATLKSEITAANDTLRTMRQSYVDLNRALKQYYTNVNTMQVTLTNMQAKLARNEKRLSILAREHPQLVQKAVNEEVQKRMACMVAAARGETHATINDNNINCN